MDLITGQIYTTKEMLTFFNVSKDTWKKKKEKLLLHFGNFYEYEVEYDSKDRRKINYKIIKQLGKYEPPQKKSVIRDKTYENKIVKVIEVDNIQTAKNVSRIIKDTDEIKAFKHTEGTVYEYTRVRMRNMFGVKAGESGLLCFLTAKEKFKEKYGYYPIKVPVYELSAYEATEETNEMEKIAA